MKNLLLMILFIISTSFPVYAGGYDFQALEEMIFDAEYIVEAEIKNIIPNMPSDYEIHIIENIYNEIREVNTQVHFFLPPTEHDGIMLHILLPGSGMEWNLKKSEKYILFLKKYENQDMHKYELLRAEPITKKNTILGYIKNKSPYYIKKTEQQAQAVLDEFNSSDLSDKIGGPFLLGEYEKSITEETDKTLLVKYELKKSINLRGHPQHFFIRINKETLETTVFKGR